MNRQIRRGGLPGRIFLVVGFAVALAFSQPATPPPAPSLPDTTQNAKIRAIGAILDQQPGLGVTDSGTVDSRPSMQTSGLDVSKVVLRVIMWLGFVVILIFGLGWGIRRLGLTGRSKLTGGSMDFLEALPLGQNRNLVLIRVMDRVYLLGQTAEKIEKLETFEGDKALEIITSSKGNVSIGQFKDVFNTFMKRGKKVS